MTANKTSAAKLSSGGPAAVRSELAGSARHHANWLIDNGEAATTVLAPSVPVGSKPGAP